MKRIKTVADLAERANPENPRQITDEKLAALAKSLAEFGDLSGLVLNGKHMIGGHQRVKLLGDSPVVITKRYAKPTRVGTVAEGYVLHDGERFTYREVKWPAEKERAAMVAANAHGGEWNDFRLKEILAGLKEGGFDMDAVGFDDAQLAEILKEASPPEEFPGHDENIAIQHQCPKCGYRWSGKPA